MPKQAIDAPLDVISTMIDAQKFPTKIQTGAEAQRIGLMNPEGRSATVAQLERADENRWYALIEVWR